MSSYMWISDMHGKNAWRMVDPARRRAIGGVAYAASKVGITRDDKDYGFGAWDVQYSC